MRECSEKAGSAESIEVLARETTSFESLAFGPTSDRQDVHLISFRPMLGGAVPGLHIYKAWPQLRPPAEWQTCGGVAAFLPIHLLHLISALLPSCAIYIPLHLA